MCRTRSLELPGKSSCKWTGVLLYFNWALKVLFTTSHIHPYTYSYISCLYTLSNYYAHAHTPMDALGAICASGFCPRTLWHADWRMDLPISRPPAWATDARNTGRQGEFTDVVIDDMHNRWSDRRTEDDLLWSSWKKKKKVKVTLVYTAHNLISNRSLLWVILLFWLLQVLYRSF